MMGIPEARMNRSRKGSRLCLNSTRLKDISGEVITLPDSAPSSPEIRNDRDQSLFLHSMEQDSSQSVSSPFEKSPAPPVAPVASFYNLGNTCFMNCMLHVLRYTPEFLQLLGNLRAEIDKEESMLKDESEKDDQRTAWQLLRNMHDLYTEMSLKEFQYRELLPTSSGAMALRPYALLDSIRLLNPLFEGNMQHDAQELLRCLLCGLDDAELELQRSMQKRCEKQELLRKSSISTDLTLNEGLPPLASQIVEKKESILKSCQNTAQKQPLLKGGRRRYKKKDEASAASKGLLASFLKAKEVPGIMTKVDQPQEPIEGVGLDNKSSDLCFTGINESRVNTEGSQVGPFGDATAMASNFNQSASSAAPLSTELSPISMSSGRSSPLSDVIYNGGTAYCSSSQPLLKSVNGSEMSSLDHVNYLNSVKLTESRRSRLGVRGKAKSFITQDKKMATLTSSSSVVDNFRPSPTWSTESKISENPSKKRADKLDKACNGTKRGMDSLSSGIPGFQRIGSLKISSSSPILEEADKIVEIPLTKDVETTSQNSKEKPVESPQRGGQNETKEPSEGRSSVFLLTPGKEITVHSPLLTKPTFYTPPQQRSRNLLSRLGHLIPSSARRFLSFSAEEDSLLTKEKTTGMDVSPSFADEENQKMTSNSSKVTPGKISSDDFNQKTHEYLRKAQIQLRRCDWLGVSPVKSISARYVLKEVSKSQKDSILRTGGQGIAKGQSGDSLGMPGLGRKGKRSHDGRLLSCPDTEVKSEIDSDNGEAKSGCLINSEAASCKAAGSGIVSNSLHSSVAKRLKIGTSNLKDKGRTSISGAVVDCKLLPKVSISLEKCDWLMNAGEKSVKVSKASKREMYKMKRKTSPVHRSESNSCPKVKVELLPPPSSSPSLPSGQPVPRLAYNLFGGTMSHQTRCCECESISDQSEEFLDISIPVPKAGSCSSDNSDDEMSYPHDDSMSLLLQSLASRERIYGENKYFCENCHHLVEAERSCHITALPKVLAIHLKRFHANSSAIGGVCKINDHVAVPTYLPCLLHKCRRAQPTCSHRYHLYAVVTHSGASIRHGHYRTYIRVTSNDNQLTDFKKDQEQEPSSPSAYRDVPSEVSTLDDYHSSLPDSMLSSASSKEGMLSRTSFNNNSPVMELNGSSSPEGSHDKLSVKADAGEESSTWWIECDDDYIQVFSEEEFFGKLSQNKGCLLGTPYVLFYHQTQDLSGAGMS